MNVDDLFVQLGQFGPFQFQQYILLAFPIVFSAYQTITFLFTTSVPNFRCLVPECEDEYYTEFDEPWLNSALPFKGRLPEQCLRFKPLSDFTRNSSDMCSAYSLFDERDSIPCDRYVFTKDEVTIASEFEIVCEDNGWKLFIVVMNTYLGFIIGMPIAGIISDRIGRKTVMIYSWFLQSLIAIAQSFSRNYKTFLILQTMGALCCGAYNAGFVMALETLGPASRVLGNALISCFHTLGQANVGMTMWLWRDWRIMNRILYGPGLLLCPIYFWLVPESVRWLISRGRSAEAMEVCRKIAGINNRHLSTEFEDNVRALAEVNIIVCRTIEEPPHPVVQNEESTDLSLATNNDNNGGNDAPHTIVEIATPKSRLPKILKSKILLLRLFYCVIVWSSVSMLFSALSMKSVTISGNKYLNFILAVLVELPGYMASYVVMDTVDIGRRMYMSITVSLTALCCFLFFFIQQCECLQKWKIATFLTAKLSITSSFAVLYIYTSEMFPTEIRNSILGICSMAAHVGSVFAPITILLVSEIAKLTLIFYGISVLSLLAIEHFIF
ncbi:solute carrier family 22 member 4 [Nilaparvata lugens]|uniref:solute carrier family 22 member 4 n=1 Tax=Nilaparvata lugens TaxID=108931 RepID=UPI00193D0D67|nr:solute carrier family 22 member 4 [Nilaparvata lugens]